MIELETGSLTPDELECVFGNLPFEVTFADARGIVRFYNRPPDMVFTRSKDILGRSVKLDVAEFVKTVRGRIMHIRYIAARDRAGAYLGCLEVAQDITRIKTLEPGRE